MQNAETSLGWLEELVVRGLGWRDRNKFPQATALLVCLTLGASCQAPPPPPPQAISPIRIVSMQYPSIARVGLVQGTVELEANISSQGTAEDIRTLSGVSVLAYPAKAALAKWRFTACTSAKRGCVVKLDFSFVLSGTCSLGENCPTEFEVDLPNKVLVKSKAYDSVME